MCLQPQRTSTDGRIDTELLPLSHFITRAMHLPVMTATEGYSELITDLTTKCPRLRKTQMMGIGRASTADQARLSSNRFDVFAITNPTRRRQDEHAFVDSRSSPQLFSARCRILVWVERAIFADRLTSKARQFGLERLFNGVGISRCESVFGSEGSIRPICRFFGRI
jgi:hypothetical protein